MRKISTIILISLLLILPMLSGCIGGGDDKEVVPWEGDVNDLLLDVEDLGEGYDVETEYYEDPEEFADDATILNAHGFQEGAMADFALFDWENIIIGAEMVLRFGADKMEGVLEDFKSTLQEEEGEDTTFEEINLGKYGDETIAFKIVSADLEGFGAYAIGFIKNDIMVLIMTVSEDDDGDLVKSLIEKVLAKF